jgi:hypothetical protein
MRQSVFHRSGGPKRDLFLNEGMEKFAVDEHCTLKVCVPMRSSHYIRADKNVFSAGFVLTWTWLFGFGRESKYLLAALLWVAFLTTLPPLTLVPFPQWRD